MEKQVGDNVRPAVLEWIDECGALEVNRLVELVDKLAGDGQVGWGRGDDNRVRANVRHYRARSCLSGPNSNRILKSRLKGLWTRASFSFGCVCLENVEENRLHVVTGGEFQMEHMRRHRLICVLVELLHEATDLLLVSIIGTDDD